MSYIPSSDDDSTSIPIIKSNKHRGNINHSKKYIQPKNNNITDTDLHTKIQNFTSRQKKIIIPTRHQRSKNLVTTHRTRNNKIKNSNNSNINVQQNNSTDNSQNDGRYGNHRHNKSNDFRREKQSIEGEYDSKKFRHLQSIESRIKKYSKRKNKNIHE